MTELDRPELNTQNIHMTYQTQEQKHDSAEQNSTTQNRTAHHRTGQNRTEQNRTEQNRTEQSSTAQNHKNRPELNHKLRTDTYTDT